MDYGDKFILSMTEDILKMAEHIQAKGLNLRMAYDVPQIYKVNNAKTEKQYVSLLEQAKRFIGGVQL